MLKFTKLPLAVALTATATAAFAQNPGPLNNLPETVVSATTLETPTSQIGNSVTVITRAQIERDQIRTITDLLRVVPGLNVVQTGVGQTSVFMRGTNSAHVKVLIDGIDVSDPSGPTRVFDFGALTVEDIERVEILRGPQSGLYGADAIGGVISITTARGRGPAKTRALIEGGSFGTFNKAANVSGGDDRKHFSLTVSNFRAASVPVTPNRLNDSGENTTATTKFGFNFSEHASLNFVGRYTENDLRYWNSGATFRETADNRQFHGLTELAFHSLMSGRLNSAVGITYSDIMRKTITSFGPNSFQGDRARYYWKSDLTLVNGHTLIGGVQHDEDIMKSSFATSRVFNTNTGTFLELHSAFTDRIFLTSNIRHDDNQSFGGHTTWRIAPAFLIHETNTKLKASYGTGFRAPSLSELDPGSGNPNLRPEVSKGFDAGFEQGLMQNRLRFGATYFNNKIQDIIVLDGAFVPQNTDRARIDGFEGFVAADIRPRFQVRADYTHMRAIDALTLLQLPRRPDDKVSFTAVWTATDRLSLSFGNVWNSAFSDIVRGSFPSQRTPMPGYNIAFLAANYKLNEQWIAFGRLENAFDDTYQNPHGYMARGFGAYAGLRFQQ